jgi:hypothetical protein
MCEVKKPKSVSPMIDFCTGLLNACYSHVYPFMMTRYHDYVKDMTDIEIRNYDFDIKFMLGSQIARNKKLLTKGQH